MRGESYSILHRFKLSLTLIEGLTVLHFDSLVPKLVYLV